MSEFDSDLIVADEIPQGGRGTYADFHRKAELVMNSPELRGKAVCIGHFEDTEDGAGRQKASSAVQSLRQKYGFSPEASGLKITAAKVRPAGATEDRRGVWVQHNPEWVVEGALEAHQAKIAETARKQQETKKKKEAAQKRAAAKSKEGAAA